MYWYCTHWYNSCGIWVQVYLFVLKKQQGTASSKQRNRKPFLASSESQKHQTCWWPPGNFGQMNKEGQHDSVLTQQAILASLDAPPTTSCSNIIALCMSWDRGHPLICFPKSTDLQPAARSSGPAATMKLAPQSNSQETCKWDRPAVTKHCVLATMRNRSMKSCYASRYLSHTEPNRTTYETAIYNSIFSKVCVVRGVLYWVYLI
jgi:hypothetical protein